MSCLSYYKTRFTRFYAERAVADHAAVQRAAERLGLQSAIVIESRRELPEAHRNERTLVAVPTRGNAVDRCPGSRGHVCCNYLTIDLYAGCTLGCSYCIMQSYRNFAPLVVNVETDPIVAAVRSIAAANPGRRVRVGTGQIGDSLQLDPLFELSRELIEAFAAEWRIELELKTKTDFVDHLLSLPQKGNAIIAFSLNPPQLVRSEEPETASVERRLAAADRALQAGYRVAFHFDPIIRVAEWQAWYRAVVERLRELPRERIAWVSLGTVRFTTELRDAVPPRPYMFDEFVPSRDGKLRYLQPERVETYRYLRRVLERAIGRVPIYLCMESPAVWRRVFADRSATPVGSLFAPLELPGTTGWSGGRDRRPDEGLPIGREGGEGGEHEISAR